MALCAVFILSYLGMFRFFLLSFFEKEKNHTKKTNAKKVMFAGNNKTIVYTFFIEPCKNPAKHAALF